MRQDIKQYFVLLIIGLFMAGICFGMCPGNVSAEPECALIVEPLLPGENRTFEVVQPIRMRSIAGWETASFSAGQTKTIVEDAADALVSAQNATDKGWVFNLDTGTTTADNIYGAVGLGLLRAYNMTKSKSGVDIEASNPNYLTAAGDVADKIREGGFSLQATDYIFLKYYAEVIGDANYSNYGDTVLNAVIIDTNTPAEVAAWLDTIDDDQGKLWQLANWVEVFQLYGDASYADAVVTKILDYDATAGTGSDMVRGFVYDMSNKYVRTLDQARVVEVLKRYYSTTHATEIAQGLALLKDLQYNNGYFRWACQLNVNDVTLFPSVMVQDQACALKAMAFNAQTTFDNYDNHLGVFWGANALMEMQDLGGGFTTDKQTINISEYNAEALDALHSSCREGDVDRSGKVMPWDALNTLKAAVGMIDLDGPALLAADRNGDGAITAMDALKILQSSVGKDIAVTVGDSISDSDTL
ncbi:MAG: dockerin type I repeat-containing protein [bacterium]